MIQKMNVEKKEIINRKKVYELNEWKMKAIK